MAAMEGDVPPPNPHDPAVASVLHAQWALRHGGLVALRESAELGLTAQKPPRFAREAIPVFLSYVTDLLQLRDVHVERTVRHAIPDGHEHIIPLALSWMSLMMDLEDWDALHLLNLACSAGVYEGASAFATWPTVSLTLQLTQVDRVRPRTCRAKTLHSRGPRS